MRALVPSVAVRAGVLGAVTWSIWAFVDPEHGWGPLQEVFWTLVVTSTVWAGVDGVRGARRGDPVWTGLLRWIAVAAAAGLLQPLAEVVLGGAGLSIGRLVRGMLAAGSMWAAVVAVPAVVSSALAWTATRALRVPRRSTR